jgi:hypothetical protein
MIHPKIGAKISNAKYCDELKIADARPRSVVGNHEGNDTAVSWKDGRLRKTGEQP